MDSDREEDAAVGGEKVVGKAPDHRSSPMSSATCAGAQAAAVGKSATVVPTSTMNGQDKLLDKLLLSLDDDDGDE